MIYFNSWTSLLQILISVVAIYFGLILMLRLSGNRTLSQMNSFDFIITIAMGSTFSSGILQKDISITDCLFSLFLLIALQFLLTKLAVKSNFVKKMIKGEEVILFEKGRFNLENMARARVVEDELLSAMRSQGISTFTQLEAVVLENNGEISVIPKKISGQETLESKKSYSSGH